jgi:hypothetical protein
MTPASASLAIPEVCLSEIVSGDSGGVVMSTVLRRRAGPAFDEMLDVVAAAWDLVRRTPLGVALRPDQHFGAMCRVDARPPIDYI